MVLQDGGEHATGKETPGESVTYQPVQTPPAPTDIVKEVHLTPGEWRRIELMMRWACRTRHIKVNDQSLCSKQCQSCTVLTLEDWIVWSTSCAEWMIKQTLLTKSGFR